MSELRIGDVAPFFELSDHRGKVVRLDDFIGKPVVLIFYPGDDTSGCTKQLCAVRDDWNQFEAAGVAVVGINPADRESHEQFVSKYGLTVPLLVDVGKKIARDYGAADKGLHSLVINRTVVGIGKDGRIIFYQHGMPSNAEILQSVTNI
ncbi:MAG: peroxiredoxin [Patescibacteria group bacterium]|jgi:peroxiredoxin Q/BCP